MRNQPVIFYMRRKEMQDIKFKFKPPLPFPPPPMCPFPPWLRNRLELFCSMGPVSNSQGRNLDCSVDSAGLSSTQGM